MIYVGGAFRPALFQILLLHLYGPEDSGLNWFSAAIDWATLSLLLFLLAFWDLISLAGAGRMSLCQDNDLFSLSIFFFHIHCDLKTKLAMHF